MKLRWEQIPKEFQRRFGQAYHLRIEDFSDSKPEITFSAEWDDLEQHAFRGQEYWSATTSYATVGLRRVAEKWLITVESGTGGWSVASRISRALHGTQGNIGKITFPAALLKEILIEDSRAERFMWWHGVEEGIDGALRGALPRGRGVRARFDSDGEPFFARYESTSLGKQISISCNGGYLTSQALPADRIVKYFEEWILPKLKIQ
jgi:hypothetical protein